MRKFVHLHFSAPLIISATALYAVAKWDLDVLIADAIYNLEHGSWALQHNWITQTLIHSGGRLLTGVLLFTLVAVFLRSFWHAPWKSYRHSLSYLVLAVLLSLALINGLKAISGAPCPWDIARYGGKDMLYHWFDSFNGNSGCFPAGHASGGYIWVALYFAALAQRPALRYYALAGALLLGLTYGVAQQLRGAHFLSHDIATLSICWFTSLTIFLVWYNKHIDKGVLNAKYTSTSIVSRIN